MAWQRVRQAWSSNRKTNARITNGGQGKDKRKIKDKETKFKPPNTYKINVRLQR